MAKTRLRHFLLHSILVHIALGVVITLGLIYLFDKETGGGGGSGGRLEPILVTVIDDNPSTNDTPSLDKTPELKKSENKPQEKTPDTEDIVKELSVAQEKEAPEISPEKIVEKKPEVNSAQVKKKTQKKNEEVNEIKIVNEKNASSEPAVSSDPGTQKKNAATAPGEGDVGKELSSEPELAALPGDDALQKISGARPNYGQNPTPPYPKSARRRGYEGTVLLQVLVLENGKVGEITIKAPSGYPVLDESALKAVKKWTFIPGKKGGKEISSWVEVPIKYQLDSG